MARDRVSTDNRPESRDRGLRLQTDWDPNLAPRPRFWSDLPIGAEPGFNTGSGTPLCDFGTAEVGRWWFILHFNILYFSISPYSPGAISQEITDDSVGSTKMALRQCPLRFALPV